MNLIDYTTTWVKGEILQGKIMIIIGVILLIAMIAIFKGENTILRGTLIPLCLVLLALFGYGGFQVTSRPSHIVKVSEIYDKTPDVAIEQEYSKAQKDDKTYRTLKVIWVILIAVVALLYLLFSTNYLKGLSIGLIILFLTTLIIDSTLHQRLSIYKSNIEALIK